MKTIAVWALAVVNAALITSVGSSLFKDDRAVAQQAGATNRDDFLMIPGEINGGNNAVVYVIDETTHQMSSMSYDDSMRQLNIMTPRSLQRDFDNLGAGGGGNR